MDVFDGAHVQAAGGLDRDDQRLVPVQFTGDDGLLLVAAGHAAGDRDRALAGAHVKLVDQPVGVFSHFVEADEAVGLEGGIAEALQDHVLLQREVQHQAVLVPVLGDQAHVLAPLGDGHFADILAAQNDGSAGERFQTAQAVDELRLAVAVDTGDADDLARADIQADVVDRVVLVELGSDAHILNVKYHIAGFGRVLFDLQLHRAAHHHVGQGLLVGVAGVHRADVAALAENGNAVGHLHDLVELVGNEEDALPLGGEILHDLHQLVDLLRGQHRSGLVKDQDLVVPVEHLEDLGALLHADGDILHLRVQIHL